MISVLLDNSNSSNLSNIGKDEQQITNIFHNETIDETKDNMEETIINDPDIAYDEVMKARINNMEEKELNLREILKGHEGETFYSPIFDDVILERIDNTEKYPIVVYSKINNGRVILTEKGKYYKDNKGECLLFPSKDQRDWNKWIEEQKPKTPKTWSELQLTNNIGEERIIVKNIKTLENSPIGKAANALLKIHQLIEVGYGGNVSNEEWKNVNVCKFIPIWNTHYNCFIIYPYKWNIQPIAFHTKEQVEEFLSYPENVQLLKDYFMING